MRKRDIPIQINKNLWKMALVKIESDFGRKYCYTDIPNQYNLQIYTKSKAIHLYLES